MDECVGEGIENAVLVRALDWIKVKLERNFQSMLRRNASKSAVGIKN